uniref:UNC93-like protein MFSD11 (inferred by orthology to a human protein) n=1 Tax=Parastrongyloides trichosuri TaxID=131310 RepID=A0A0N5A3F6_PARTI
MASELLLVHFVGIGFLFLYLGYDIKAMVEENMLHSVAHIDPSRMNPYAGYYGLSINSVAGACVALITPFIVDTIGAKWSMALSGFIFTLHMSLFMFLNTYIYYGISFLIGLGVPLSWTGQGVYLKEITTKNNHLRNSAICWAVNLVSLPIGGLTLLGLEYFSNGSSLDYMSISTIRLVMAVFLATSLISFLLFSSLPNNSGSIKSFSMIKLRESLLKNITMVKDRRIQLLIPCFFFIGYETGYWIAIYPTCLIFMKNLTMGSALKVTAYYTIACGFGQIITSLVISWISKKFHVNGYKYSVILASLIHFIVLGFIFCFVPPESKYIHTTNSNFFPMNTFTALFIAFLLGAGDGAWNSVRTAVCTSQFKNETSQAVSMSRLFQSIGCSLSFILGPVLNLYIEVTALTIILIITLICFMVLNNHYLVPSSKVEFEEDSKKDIVSKGIYNVELDSTYKNINL